MIESNPLESRSSTINSTEIEVHGPTVGGVEGHFYMSSLALIWHRSHTFETTGQQTLLFPPNYMFGKLDLDICACLGVQKVVGRDVTS